MTGVVNIMMNKELPVFQTERLLISALTLKDIKNFVAHRNQPEVARYQNWYPVSEAEVEQLIFNQSKAEFGRPDQWYQFAIRLLPDYTFIGDIGLHFVTNFYRQVEIGYSISMAYQRKGYGRESVQAVLSYCFSNLNLEIVSATIDVRNTASQRLLESLGFQLMATRPHACYQSEAWCDEADYGLFAAQREKVGV